MPGKYYLYYLLVWVFVGFLAFWKAGSKEWGGVGLALAFFINMAINHWFGALVCFLPWYNPPAGMQVVEQGFGMSTLGIVAFAIGCFVIAPFLLTNTGRTGGWTPPPPRVTRTLVIVGICSYLALAVGLGRLPSMSAVLGTGTNFMLVSICIGLWDATTRGDRRLSYALAASTLLLPIFTILTQGFLGYGIVYVVIVLSFFVVMYKRRMRLLLAVLPLGFLALSFYVTYMRDRSAIRGTVWGGRGYDARVAQFVGTCQTMEWFDLRNPKHLERIDGRLNQNWLVGAAMSHLDVTKDYARGETIWTGLGALIPRAIWPGKRIFAGSGNLVSQYTGLVFAYGTSVGMGLIFEFYVNFGSYGVFGGLFVFGLLVGIADRKAGTALRSGSAFDFAMWFLVGIALLNVGGSLVEIMPGLVAAVVVTVGLKRLLGSEPLVPEPLPQQPIDQLNP